MALKNACGKVNTAAAFVRSLAGHWGGSSQVMRGRRKPYSVPKRLGRAVFMNGWATGWGNFFFVGVPRLPYTTQARRPRAF